MTYYIYHIPGIKIGCTNQPEKRMSDQGFTEWEILETHTDIHEASNREMELQEEYGYRIDNVPYWQSVENRHVWNDKTRHVLTSEDGRKGGSIGGLFKPSKETKRKMSFSKSKLRNEADIIRERFKQWDSSKHKFEIMIAEEYGVSRSTINRILRNFTY